MGCCCCSSSSATEEFWVGTEDFARRPSPVNTGASEDPTSDSRLKRWVEWPVEGGGAPLPLALLLLLLLRPGWRFHARGRSSGFAAVAVCVVFLLPKRSFSPIVGS